MSTIAPPGCYVNICEGEGKSKKRKWREIWKKRRLVLEMKKGIFLLPHIVFYNSLILKNKQTNKT